MASAQISPPAVVFTPAAGTFVGKETVRLRAEGRAEIHYTLDGSLPTPESPVYRAPITLERSTRVRAMAVLRGAAGAVASETYLRVGPDAQAFTSHLPVILIHTFESGALDPLGVDYVPAAMQMMEPVAGTSHMLGRAALDARIGIHVRGASSRNFPKVQYAVELRADDSEADSPRALLGLPRGAEWVLSDPLVYDRSLIRNALTYELSNRIGRYAPRTRFAEAYLVDDGGDVRSANFLGFFTLIEKIGRGAERVNVSRLPASATTAPAMTGGFILRIDKGAPDMVAGGRWMQFVYPSSAAMLLPERAPQRDFIATYIDDFVRAVSAPDFQHPVTRQPYSDFIDVNAWIDHHILNVLAKNPDGLRISAYFHKEQRGRLAAGPVWDFDRSFGTPYDVRATDPEEWRSPYRAAADYFNEGWWRWLFRDPEFRARYAARFKSLLSGPLAPEAVDRVVDRMVTEVGDAAERDFRRWPQTLPERDSYAAEIARLKDFVHRRATWIKAQLDATF